MTRQQIELVIDLARAEAELAVASRVEGSDGYLESARNETRRCDELRLALRSTAMDNAE